MKNIINQISNLRTSYKIAIVLIVDIVFAISTFVLLHFLLTSLSNDYNLNSKYLINFYLIFLFIPIFYFFGIYKIVFRFINLYSLDNLIKASLVYLIFSILITLIVDPYDVNFILSLIQPILFLSLLIISRVIFAILSQGNLNNANQKKLIIYGSGEAGVQSLSVLSRNNQYYVEAFLDDDYSKIGRQINNKPIIGIDKLEEFIRVKKISSIFVAIPSLDLKKRQEIVSKLEKFNITIKILPSLFDMVGKDVSIGDFKDVDVNDILERKIKLDERGLLEDFRGKVILITGAGGSIGSELTLQVTNYQPSKLILIDNSEFNLYTIEQKIKRIIEKTNINLKVECILTSVIDIKKINLIFEKYKPEYVFHAAAYKHVPLLETNIQEAVTNNVFGTLNMLQSSIEYGSKKFVLISTDKAVRPTNIMGATKRFSELCLQSLHDKYKDKINMSIVRFGNVLNSSGSVIPLFVNQIKEGGPVTVTHPEVTRYFMSINEAVSLIFQASLISRGGEVFLLDMGDQVKIVDLARKIIKLSGMKEQKEQKIEGDIEIEFVGLRPGEKLKEELLIGNNPKKTQNEHIMMGNETFLDLSDLEILIKKLEDALKNDNIEIIKEVFHNKYIDLQDV